MQIEPLLFIDIETTGLNPDIHEIIEIGALLVSNTDGYPVVKTFACKVQPTHIENADPRALKVNQYDEALWDTAVPLAHALQDLAKIADGAIPVGHNISFDISFLEKAYRANNLPVPFHFHKLDTISIAFAKIGHHEDVRQYSLRALCERFNIVNTKSHTALADAQATYDLFMTLMNYGNK